jgi:peptidoglycan hydrolase-like protein with peptidoglycan-binding domain
MAAKGTKQTKTKKTPKKLLGFVNLKNRRFVLMIVVVLGFAAGGTFWLYDSSSAATRKNLNTVSGCRASGVVLRSGSTGSCVQVVQSVLNAANNVYRDAAWGDISTDGNYGPVTGLAVTQYQQAINARFNPDIATDGIVGAKTWYYLDQITCVDITSYLPACN